MWYSPPKITPPPEDINKYLLTLKGELNEKEARITLIKFLYRNLGFTVELLTGIKLYPDQIVILKGMLASNYNMCIWGRGSGKCLLYNKDSQILTKEFGLISLTDLLPDIDFLQGERWIDLPLLHFWNGEQWCEVSKALIQESIPAMRIETSNGYSLSGSSNHLVQVWNTEKCEVEWKRYHSITTDDYICINQKPSNLPTKDTKNIEEAYLVGLLLGDGCLVARQFTYSSSDEELLSYIEKYPSGKRRPDKRSKAISIALATEFSEYLAKKYNLPLGKSYTKEIPAEILKDKDEIIACLQGLFDTDGCAYKGVSTIEFCSTSIVMAKQVQNLLNLFGIISRLKCKKTQSNFGKAYCVTISGEQSQKFEKLIGFRLSRKKETLHSSLNVIFNTNKNIIPGLIEYCQKNIKSKIRLPGELSKEWKIKIRKRGSQNNLSYKSINNYINFFKKTDADTKEIQKLENIKNQNFYFDKVKVIEDLGRKNCIDFNVPTGEKYWSNGFISHNTFISAVFCILQTIFFPDSGILIAGPTFRTSRFIFNKVVEISEGKNAQLLYQALGVMSRRNDEYKILVNGGSVVAIPLSGDKVRGYRANVLVIDELLLMEQEIVEKVLMPFLVVPQNLTEKQIIRAKEDELIRRGVLKEEERMVFPNRAKFIGLSSASFKCEYLYKKYEEFVQQIYNPSEEDKKNHSHVKYFVSQLAWNAIPEDRMDKDIIKLAQSDESNSATFRREYGAEFTDDSDSYFSMKKMIQCTIPDGESPSLLLSGDKSKKYLLSIDPNWSNSETSDNFSMCVMEIDEDKLKEGKESGTVVHNYGRFGVDLKAHIKYFYYLWKNFNIVMIIIDHAGYQFIESANESELFRKDGVEFKLFDFHAEKDGSDLEQELKTARRQYNRQINKIVFTQYFTTEFITKANQYLQGCIDYKKIWFGSGIKADASAFNKAISTNIDLSLVDEIDLGEFVDTQEMMLKQTKYECASIEMKATAKGTQSFDLPVFMKKDNTSSRTRRDNYTALLLSAWCLKSYKDILNVPPEDNSGFTPVLV